MFLIDLSLYLPILFFVPIFFFICALVFQSFLHLFIKSAHFIYASRHVLEPVDEKLK